MAKRFTDTELYNKAWFRKLPPRIKCLWEWLRCNCDPAGIVDFDAELASFQIGETVIFEDLQHFSDRIRVLDDGKIWLSTFISYQYGELCEGYNPHKAAVRSLEKHKIDISSLGQGCAKVGASLAVVPSKLLDKDKDQDQYKVKDKDKDQDQEREKKEIGALPDFQTSDELKDFLKTIPFKQQKIWIQTYQDIDFLRVEFLKMVSWIIANPQKAPKKRLVQFIAPWLSKAWERHRKSIPSNSGPPQRRYGKETAQELQDRILNIENPYEHMDTEAETHEAS